MSVAVSKNSFIPSWIARIDSNVATDLITLTSGIGFIFFLPWTMASDASR
jgi:hypothetical protein